MGYGKKRYAKKKNGKKGGRNTRKSIVPRFGFSGMYPKTRMMMFPYVEHQKMDPDVYPNVLQTFYLCVNMNDPVAAVGGHQPLGHDEASNLYNHFLVAGGINIEKLKWKVKINKFYPWESIILNILKEPADDRTFYWIWEPNGCAGKTTFQKYIFQNFENVVVLSGKSTDMKNGIIQFIEKNNETPDIVLINIPRSNIDFVSYEGLECIKDMFFFSGKYEGGMVCGKPPHLFIFANEKPPDDKLSSDRLKVFKI